MRAATSAWRSDPTPATSAALADRIGEFLVVLEGHLDEEEHVVVPLIDRHLTKAEWQQVGQRGFEKFTPAQRWIATGQMVEVATGPVTATTPLTSRSSPHVPEHGERGSLPSMGFAVARVVPIMWIFDEARAREFYVDYLGCTVDWEHRFDERAPLYMQVSRGDLVLHLSEHHGDGAPGHTVYVAASGVRELHAELQTRNYGYLNPGVKPSPGLDEGGACVTLLDPFGNCPRIDEREHSRI